MNLYDCLNLRCRWDSPLPLLIHGRYNLTLNKSTVKAIDVLEELDIDLPTHTLTCTETFLSVGIVP